MVIESPVTRHHSGAAKCPPAPRPSPAAWPRAAFRPSCAHRPVTAVLTAKRRPASRDRHRLGCCLRSVVEQASSCNASCEPLDEHRAFDCSARPPTCSRQSRPDSGERTRLRARTTVDRRTRAERAASPGVLLVEFAAWRNAGHTCKPIQLARVCMTPWIVYASSDPGRFAQGVPAPDHTCTVGGS